ncbi:MAG: hypothetical protein CL583_04175 [Alteromonadaceae bacterium]|nr:hypothetical protein [Alteromonadaceae bacterium]|tara:strand:+ start:3500 stop:4198 length:699 start_codon:yes stop_codon:yes gene_type:complete
MEKHKIAPERITKPIQLLGAWLVGLLTIDGAFLITAANMAPSSWQQGALTIAAIANVPVFIIALFLLQTKFRPELQEDSYYSTYLSSRTNELIKISRSEAFLNEIEKKIENIEKKFKESTPAVKEADRVALSDLSFGINFHLENKKEILDELSAIGVVGYTSFGESVEPPEPHVNKVAVSRTLPEKQLGEVLRVARKLGFSQYGYIDHYEDIDEDVLFGAYGENDLRKIIPA